MSQLLINNNLASAGIDIYSGTTSLYREVHYFFFCTFPLGMTSAAHIHAKCSVTISEEKKNILLLNTVRSAEFSPKKKYYSPVCCSWKPRGNTSKNRMGRNNTRSHTAPTNKVFLEVKGYRRMSNQYIFQGQHVLYQPEQQTSESTQNIKQWISTLRTVNSWPKKFS